MDPDVLGSLLFVGVLALMDYNRRVSRNKGASPSTTPAEGTGPKWEQDEPYALMIDDLEED